MKDKACTLNCNLRNQELSPTKEVQLKFYRRPKGREAIFPKRNKESILEKVEFKLGLEILSVGIGGSRRALKPREKYEYMCRGEKYGACTITQCAT